MDGWAIVFSPESCKTLSLEAHLPPKIGVGNVCGFSVSFLFGAFLSHLILAKCIWLKASGAEECSQ